VEREVNEPAPIRVGVGGWNFEPWRPTFYPPDLPKARELDYASRRLTAIEINGTFYRTPSRESLRKWAAATPDEFTFTLKAPRYCSYRKDPSTAAEAIQRFLTCGLEELGPKLGPILWQFPPTTPFEPDAFARFLDLLPPSLAGLRLQHALEVRNPAFADPKFVELARGRGAATVVAHSTEYPEIFDVTGDFIYLRLQRARGDEPTGYPAAELDLWARRLSAWRAGENPDDLPLLAPPMTERRARPCWAYFINGAKERAPAAAMALLERLQG
jgi:uncharacterized protein YecE (DUF72 family)